MLRPNIDLLSNLSRIFEYAKILKTSRFKLKLTLVLLASWFDFYYQIQLLGDRQYCFSNRRITQIDNWLLYSRREIGRVPITPIYRYIQDESGKWQDVLAQERCKQRGFNFCIRTDAEIDLTRYRNLKYLGKYLDGYLGRKYVIDSEIQDYIKGVLESYTGISLRQLLEKIELGTIDDLNALIATEQIYVDLSAVSLTEQQKVNIFRDEATAQAYITVSTNYSESVNSSLQTVDIKVGSSFLLDGKCLTVDHLGDSKIILSGQEGLIRWTHQKFQQLLELGEVTNLQTEKPDDLSSIVCSSVHHF